MVTTGYKVILQWELFLVPTYILHQYVNVTPETPRIQWGEKDTHFLKVQLWHKLHTELLYSNFSVTLNPMTATYGCTLPFNSTATHSKVLNASGVLFVECRGQPNRQCPVKTTICPYAMICLR